MKDTAYKLINDNTEIPIGRREEGYMAPCFLHGVSNKKRKQKGLITLYRTAPDLNEMIVKKKKK